MIKSVLEEIRELESRKAALADEARVQAIAEEAVALLNSLGGGYSLTIEKKQKRKVNRAGTRKPNPDKPCSICGFQTDPPHDARHHKNQEVKRPFTDEEIAARGWKKVEPVAAAEEKTVTQKPTIAVTTPLTVPAGLVQQ